MPAIGFQSAGGLLHWIMNRSWPVRLRAAAGKAERSFFDAPTNRTGFMG
jgi:hypothetical protein